LAVRGEKQQKSLETNSERMGGMAEKIDINQADVETLAALSGIGPKLAAKIVDYRTAVHPFEELIELVAVPGVSERMVRELADQLTVGELALEETAESPPEELPLEEIAIVDDEEESVMEEEAADAPVVDLADVGETAEPEPEMDEPPVVVTMLEAEPERPTAAIPPERAVALPSARPVERTIVETVQRRHSHLLQQFFGVIAGALFGSLLTLALLYLFNGTLRFAANDRANDLRTQLEEETSAMRQAQSSMTDEMGALAGRLAELDNDFVASGEVVEGLASDVTALESQTAELGERLETINLAAEKFDTFLTGMRDLLVALQGLPAVPTPTLTLTATTTVSATVSPEAAPVEATPTPTAVSPQSAPTEAAAPTRTPRPTATPLVGN
jgi:competence ComEA-like helix-hairpin-helix protein